MSERCDWPDFIAGALSPATPPDAPLRRDDWAGMAFDRNIHEDFAPSQVWDAWMSTASEVAATASLRAIRYSTYLLGGVPEDVGEGLQALRSYWLSNGNFMHDHYVFSADANWVVRLDQDVTLFAGESTFMHRVVARLGGVASVEALVRADLIGDGEDVVGLGGYVEDLLAPLKAGAAAPALR